VRALADDGWEIGSHTVGHVVLTHEPPWRMRRELARSKHALEQWSGRRCRYFAYCNGLHSPRLVAELRRLGYEGALTTCDRPNRVGGDRFRVHRKVLWEGHARGPGGRWSPSLSLAHMHNLFGALGLTRPLDGEVSTTKVTAHDAQARTKNMQTHNEIGPAHNEIVQTHNETTQQRNRIVQVHNEIVQTHDEDSIPRQPPQPPLSPPEVKLAH
jgi:hypothetical protein